MSPRMRFGSYVLLVVSAFMFGYGAYLNLLAIPRIKAEIAAMASPTDACVQGMMLRPGQSCFVTIEMPARHKRAARDDL